MSKPTLNTVIVDPVLANVSVKYKNEEYISDVIAPVQTVTKKTGIYFKYDKSNFRIVDSLRAPGSPSNEVGYNLSKETFETKNHALKQFVEDELVEQSDAPLTPETDATENVTDRLILEREKALADWMSNTANITQNTTLSGTSQWSDYTNSNPFGNVATARSVVRAAIGVEPNTLVLGYDTFSTLCDHPDIVDRVKYSQFGVVGEPELARAFKVRQILIGKALYNTATEGQTDALSNVWGKHAWLVYISPNARAIKQVTFAWTFELKARNVKKWRDEDREGMYVRVGMDYTQKIVAAEAAYFIKNAVA